MRLSPLLLLALASCTWADDLGSHLPVIGERCEYWQCMTDKGRARSEEKTVERLQREEERAKKKAEEPAPVQAPAYPTKTRR